MTAVLELMSGGEPKEKQPPSPEDRVAALEAKCGGLADRLAQVDYEVATIKLALESAAVAFTAATSFDAASRLLARADDSTHIST